MPLQFTAVRVITPNSIPDSILHDFDPELVTWEVNDGVLTIKAANTPAIVYAPGTWLAVVGVPPPLLP